jgi:hypothetical protein
VATLIHLFGHPNLQAALAEGFPPPELAAEAASRPVEFGPSRPPVFTV